MSENGSAGRRPVAEAVAARRRAQVVSGLRGLTRPGATATPAATGDGEQCDLCHTSIPDDHRHLLHLVERRIECVCESCWALRSGDAEYRPTGSRTEWLPDIDMPDDVWASFQIPIGLAFFMDSTTAGCVVALYPSPAGATESELHFASWNRMVELNPILASLEPDIEGLIVNRLSDPPAYAIAPIDRCYELTGTIKMHWEGLSGGAAVQEAVDAVLRPHPRAGGALVSTHQADLAAEPVPAAPEPDFEVLGARTVRHAASPMLMLDLQVSEPTGRQVYMIALTIQVMIEPARRTYDAPTRERLAGLFGPPERWSVTTRSLVWSQLDVVVPAFTGSTTIAVPIACNYDMEVAASKYLHSLPDGEAPLAMHFNGVVYYPNDDGTLQMVLIPWSRSVGFRMPVSVWSETIEHYYPNTAWVALRSQTLDLLERRRVDRAHATFDATVRELLDEPDAV